MKAFVIIGQAFRTLYEELFHLLLMSVVTWIATLLVLPGPFAQAGLWRIAQHGVEGRETTWRVFWEGAKEYGPRNWANTLLLAVGYLLIALNLWFYNNANISPLSPDVAVWLSAVWIALGTLWTAVAFYLLAFQMEMIEPRFWLSVRNALFLSLLHPIQTVIFLMLLGAIVLVCVQVPMLLPLLILLPGLGATLSVTSVKALVKPILEREEGGEDEASEEQA